MKLVRVLTRLVEVGAVMHRLSRVSTASHLLDGFIDAAARRRDLTFFKFRVMFVHEYDLFD